MAVFGCVSDGKPRTFTCWYGIYNGGLYFKSRTESVHSKAFKILAEAAVCIYDHEATYPDSKTGVQLIGEVVKVTDREEMSEVVNVFAKRFGDKVLQKNNLDDLCKEDTDSTFYRFTPNKIKLVSKDLSVHMDEYEDFNLNN